MTSPTDPTPPDSAPPDQASTESAPQRRAPQRRAPQRRGPKPGKRIALREPVGPRLNKLLQVVIGLFALLAVNAVFLSAVSFLEWINEETYQNWFYLLMFLAHLILGVAIVVPVVIFGLVHMRNSYNRPNRRAVRAGYALFITALVLLASGIVLTRVEGVIEVKDPAVRSVAYWLHVVTPLLAAWLFVLHRLAGTKIRWKVGARWAVAAAVVAGGLLILQAQDPRQWNVAGPESGEQYFFPSLSRTATGDFIPEKVLDNNAYCAQCHADTHERWENSVHHFSSFNNPPYLASVAETREHSKEIYGTVVAARFCAGCHDPVVFFSGKFDDPNFDMHEDPAGQAGITCTVCHSITHVNSPRGNSDYTIEEPVHYPFAFAESETLQWVNRQLVKAKPALHKKTFLKPLHKSTEFCGSCHKVHLPEELNQYKWLRGQNHYDSFFLSGVSGQGITSFYYPPKAESNCNECHMQLRASEDFGARVRDDSGELKVHDHLFPSANTGIPHLVGMEDWVKAAHAEFNEGVMRVDIFGLRRGGTVDGELVAPIRPTVPALVPGESYLLETVLRTLKMGHHFTQGTADSNQVWVDVLVTSGDRVLGRSGGMDEENRVDPWSHFVNAYVLDREGNRIDRRNAEDIFVALYNHQIPPGAGDVIHYGIDLPPDVTEPVTVSVKLRYRKFDTTYLRFVYGEDYINDLPVMTLAEDAVTFPVAAAGSSWQQAQLETAGRAAAPDFPEWQRFNDYGIGLLRKGGKGRGQLRQAEEAFIRVEELGRPDGPLNLARVYLAQGTVRDQAIQALERAASFDPPAPSWSVAYFTGLVNKQNGYLDEAIENFRSVVDAQGGELQERGFDFSKDYRLLNELGQTLFERAKQERGEARRTAREALLTEAKGFFQQALELDPENAAAHFNLDLLLRQLGDAEGAAHHRELYQTYKPDDNARDSAIAAARAANPAADHAADAVVIYDLQRDEAYEIESSRRADAFELRAAPPALPPVLESVHQESPLAALSSRERQSLGLPAPEVPAADALTGDELASATIDGGASSIDPEAAGSPAAGGR